MVVQAVCVVGGKDDDRVIQHAAPLDGLEPEFGIEIEAFSLSTRRVTWLNIGID